MGFWPLAVSAKKSSWNSENAGFPAGQAYQHLASERSQLEKRSVLLVVDYEKNQKKSPPAGFLDFEGSGGDIAAGLRCIGSNSVVRKAVKRKPQQV